MLSQLYKYLQRVFNIYHNDLNTTSFIKHNQNIFKANANYSKRKSVVLFELNGMHSAHIAYSYLANVLAAKDQAKILAYLPRRHASIREKILFQIKSKFGTSEHGVYKSFGVKDFVGISINGAQKLRAKNLLREVIPRLDSKSDIEEIKVDGVWIGDLVYDSYLMENKLPTIDKDSQHFQIFLLGALELFIFWLDFFDTNDVKAINVSHCVYTLALPLRIAIARDVPAYQIGLTHAYQLQKNKLFAYNDFFEYREIFSKLPITQQKQGTIEAEKRIKRRFAGEVGVDMSYSSKSAYGSHQHPRLLKESNNQKILIATHCFFDSPHSYGNNLFPDFWEWLEFLGKLSEVTQYDWYIKTHPDYLPGTREIIEKFSRKYPKFRLLPADSSHHQIIAEGINAVLTVYGTIGFEYAALGIPVINASLNNPHIAYDFNIHPINLDQYREILMNIGEIKIDINRQQVFEYYYMRNIYNTQDIFLDDYDKTIESIGGYDAQFSPIMYKAWLGSWTPIRHQAIISGLTNFINSGDFRMGNQHSKNLESKHYFAGEIRA
jgi:hypothetical protein